MRVSGNIKKYIVYCHIFPNGKRYVGITSQKPSERWRNGNGYKGSTAVYRAINKYGWHNIEHRILYENLSKVEAEKLEIKLIKEWNTLSPNGYNLCEGGNLVSGHKVSDKTKKYLRKINLGKKYSKEVKKKQTIAHSEKIVCLDTGKIYDGCREAARLTGGDKDGIRLCVKGVYKQTHGTRWMKLDDLIKGGDLSCLKKNNV